MTKAPIKLSKGQEYLAKQRKKRIITSTSVIAGVLVLAIVLGTVIMIGKQSSNKAHLASMIPGTKMGQRPGNRGGFENAPSFVERLIDENGNIDYDMVEQIKERIENAPEDAPISGREMFSEQIEKAIDDDLITSSQADELLDLLDLN